MLQYLLFLSHAFADKGQSSVVSQGYKRISESLRIHLPPMVQTSDLLQSRSDSQVARVTERRAEIDVSLKIIVLLKVNVVGPVIYYIYVNVDYSSNMRLFIGKGNKLGIWC